MTRYPSTKPAKAIMELFPGHSWKNARVNDPPRIEFFVSIGFGPWVQTKPNRIHSDNALNDWNYWNLWNDWNK
jgi:hypothetical protein